MTTRSQLSILVQSALSVLSDMQSNRANFINVYANLLEARAKEAQSA